MCGAWSSFFIKWELEKKNWRELCGNMFLQHFAGLTGAARPGKLPSGREAQPLVRGTGVYVSCSNVGSRVRGLVATSILGRPACSMSAMNRPACSMLADKVGRPEKASRPQKASRSSCNDEDGSNGSKALASIGKVARGEGDRGDTQNSMNHLKALFAQGHTEPLETYKDLVWDDGTRMDHIICPGCNEDCWPPLAPWGRCSRCEQYASPTKAEYWNRDVKKLKRIVSEPLEPSEVS